MNANLKVILIVALGVSACLLSVLFSQHFRANDRNNLQVLSRIERVAAGIEQIRLLGRSYVQNTDPDTWERISGTMESVRTNLHAAPRSTGQWLDEIDALSRRLDDYDRALTQLREPALNLNTEKDALQEIGLSFLQEVEQEIIIPFRREEGERIYAGESIDPFKARAKDAAYDLVALHSKQQLILLELILSLDLDAYRREKQKISDALERHELQLQYMAVLIGDKPSLHNVLGSLDQKLQRLLAHEGAIIECCAQLAEFQGRLDSSGSTLLAAGNDLASMIASDTARRTQLNRAMNWALLVGIIGGMGVLGTLLARNIIQFVNDLRKTQRELEGRDSILRATLESNIDGVLIVADARVILHYNSRFCEMWSIPPGFLASASRHELTQHVMQQLAEPDGFADRINAIIREPKPSEDTLCLKDGRTLERYSYPLSRPDCEGGRVWVFRDVTERKQAERERQKLEAQLRQSQKMEAIGQLAGGVAHDFNNILTAIFGNVELAINELESRYPNAGGVLDGMHQVERSAQRASTLTRQLLAFSRRQVTRPEVLNLNTTIAELEKMLRRLITEDIALELALCTKTCPVKIDPGQLEQVVVNLVVNARDAMPDGGKLSIETNRIVLDADYVAVHPEAQPGEHVLLAVSDTGCGMDPTTVERVFEPFFTTKPTGQGTGLGLATVYGIVKQVGGHVSVYSELDHGTTFRIFFPPASEPVATAETSMTMQPPPSGTETIIICEDDNAVRELTGQILEDAGYCVLAAHSATDALQLATNHAGPVQLLITDVIMPDMNGRKLADALAAIRPATRTLFVSGYTANVIAHHGVLEDNVEFLEKPFSRRQLLQRVREVLDRQKLTP